MLEQYPKSYFGSSPFGSFTRPVGNRRIFIGYDDTQLEAYHVLCHSLQKYAIDHIDIYPLILPEFRSMGKWTREHDPLQSTEFTYLRFAVPWLCGYHGTALFMDSDMLCLDDISKLFELSMHDYALRVVKHEHNPVATTKMRGQVQTNYPRKNWSSLMLMDCAKLTPWSFEACNTWTGKQLHRFEGIPDDQIGELPSGWNDLDFYDSGTKLLHYTAGGPWLPECRKHEYGDVWFEAQQDLNAITSSSRDPD